MLAMREGFLKAMCVEPQKYVNFVFDFCQMIAYVFYETLEKLEDNWVHNNILISTWSSTNS